VDDYSLVVPTWCSLFELGPGRFIGQRVSLSRVSYPTRVLTPRGV
jgi:hypothetical protein